MAMIYDLDNEYGGVILSDSGTGAPALQINSNDAGQPALSILSTASASPMKITALNLGVDIDTVATAGGPGIDADSANTTHAAGDFRSGATTGPAFVVGRTVNGSPTIGAVQFLGTSVASGAVMEFKGGFISCTSIDFTATAEADYMLPVSVNGTVRGIPLFQLSAVQGGATF